MKVIATARGYYGGAIIEEGQTFEIAKKSELGSWMAEVKKDGTPVKAKAAPAPAKDNDELL